MTIEVNIDEILHVHQFLVGRVFLFLTSARESVPIRKSRYKLQRKKKSFITLNTIPEPEFDGEPEEKRVAPPLTKGASEIVTQ